MKNPLKLSPRDAAWLQSTFDRRRAQFGGWTMKDDGPGDGGSGDTGTGDGTGDTGSDTDKGGNDKGQGDDNGDAKDSDNLGAGGKKALDAERTARRKLETELADLKKGLAGALGIDTGKDDGKNDDVLSTVQRELADMRHENTVLALATQHRITDAADLELLKGTRDADALNKLAARLAPTGDGKNNDGKGSDDGRGRGRPQPDRSQGGGGSTGDDKASLTSGRDRARQRHPRRATNS